MIKEFTHNNKKITLIGTAHVSKESVNEVCQVINEKKPDSVCVELCNSRLQSIKQKDKWREMDIVKVIKEKKAFLLLSNLLLAAFQKKIANKLDVKPGEEMIKAIEVAEENNSKLYPVDREIRVTLSRVWRAIGLWGKLKLLFHILLSFGGIDDIKEEDIEKMKNEDMLELILTEVGKTLPQIKEILITERDKYLAQKIKNVSGDKIVAVVGAGHVPGITKYLDVDIDLEPLEQLPKPKLSTKILKWFIPTLILISFILGFSYGGAKVGTQLINMWILSNCVFAGLGALIALASPLTIIAATIAAPLTSLNPMIAAGWVSGLVEAVTRKPKVKDFETLKEDASTIKGFWTNKVTRVLLVVVFTNIGSAIGTFIALPLMAKVIL